MSGLSECRDAVKDCMEAYERLHPGRKLTGAYDSYLQRFTVIIDDEANGIASSQHLTKQEIFALRPEVVAASVIGLIEKADANLEAELRRN